jgi:hypothetical protein
MIMTLDWIRYLEIRSDKYGFFNQIRASLAQSRVKSRIRSVIYIESRPI